jgi:hypothetical protein
MKRSVGESICFLTVHIAFCVETALRHIPHERLLAVAESALAEQRGYVEVKSVLTPDEAVHFRECPDCIDSLANITRELMAAGERKKAAAAHSKLALVKKGQEDEL